MSKICKNCGKEIDDEYDFCVYCGEKLPKHLICPECGEEFQEFGYEYCGKCGGKLVPIDLLKDPKTKLIGLSDEEANCYKFWTALLEQAENSGSGFSDFQHNFIFTDTKLFTINGVNPEIARIHNHIFFDRDRIEIKIHIPKNKALYHQLHKRKKYYNRKFGAELIWDERTEVCFILMKIDNLSMNETSEVVNEVFRVNNKFCEVFSKDIIKFLGPIEKDDKYPYWSKVQYELNKTDLSCLFSYINVNYIDISFSDLDFYYGYLVFVKYVAKDPQVRCYIRGESFDHVFDNKERIESELGFKLNWGNGMFYVTKDTPNKSGSEEDIVQWQMDMALKLDKVIPKYIKEFIFN